MVIHNLSNNLIEFVNSKLTITVYLKDKYNNESYEYNSFKKQVNTELPKIKIEYLPKEEILKEEREKNPDVTNIIPDKKNPFPTTIRLGDIQIKEHEKLNKIIDDNGQIFQLKESESEYSYQNQYERIIKITSVLNMLKTALYIFIAVFLLSIFIITYSIIGNFIYHYRNEIYITKLVGGSDVFIHGPFVLQGIIYSIISFLLCNGLFGAFLNQLSAFFIQWKVSSFILPNNLLVILLLQLLVFMIIGALSSYLATRKYIYSKI